MWTSRRTDLERSGRDPLWPTWPWRRGVSRTTASNAYNRPDQLSKAQREKVLAVAAELGYAGPDPVARSLRTRSRRRGRSDLSARSCRPRSAIRPRSNSCTASRRLARSGTGRCSSSRPGPDAKNTAMVAPRGGRWVSQSTRCPRSDPHIDAVLARPQAAVVVDSPTNIADASFVGIDDRAAFREIADHVLALGHRRLAFVCMGAAMPERSVWDGLADDSDRAPRRSSGSGSWGCPMPCAPSNPLRTPRSGSGRAGSTATKRVGPSPPN